ncbi:MAG: galactose mutarotase [Spirochaetales bacterium]|nr:galactose mutarotase [Spirochaetia bacterium]MDD7013936.1 galactose mutarotase [Spirochaetales bacterium]
MSELKFKKSRYGTLSDGTKVHLFTISNGKMSFSATDFGCTITSILLPNKNGIPTDVLLGYSSLEGYINDHGSYGAAVGRFANRIAGASFQLNGKTYSLDKNDGENCLHGGFDRYEKKVWKAKKVRTKHGLGIEFSRLSPDGEQNFPGNAKIRIIYTLNESNELTLEYFLKTDKPTPVNLTNHAYFNLKGTDGGTIEDHLLQLNCSSYLKVDEHLIPVEKVNVENDSVFDFRTQKLIGKDIAATGLGYDHAFIIDGCDGSLKKAGVLIDEKDRRSMSIYTTCPAAQIYTGNFVEGTVGKNGRLYHNHESVCIETEDFPDAPNHSDFPCCIASPAKPYYQKTVYKFDF